MLANYEPDIPELPPTDLWSDEPPLETYRHLMQIVLLLTSLEFLWQDRNDVFVAANLTIYYNLRQIKNRDFRGPDFFVVLDTERKDRKSWTVWEEDGKYPNLILEILSESTAAIDRGLKKQLYQDVFRTPEYFWYDPYTQEFAGHHLVDGTYTPIEPDAQGRLWSQQLELFLGSHEDQLRFFLPTGDLVLTPSEEARRQSRAAFAALQQVEQERQNAQAALQQVQQERQNAEQEREQAKQQRQRAEQERLRAEQQRQNAEREREQAEQQRQNAEQERLRAERLAARLRELGENPD